MRFNCMIQTVVVARFLNLEGGPRTSLVCGGWVRANRTSSGRKSLCRDVGRGLVLSMTMSLLRNSGSLSRRKRARGWKFQI